MRTHRPAWSIARRSPIGAAFAPLVALALALTLILGSIAAKPAAAIEQNLPKISLPPGFKIALYARVPRARSMAYAADLKTLFVSTRQDRIYAATDADGDFKAERVSVVATGLGVPNGIAYREGWLYAAEVARITRFRPNLRQSAPPQLELVAQDLPLSSSHFWRYAAFGPDRKLYVALGVPCNICDVDGLEGTIIRVDAEGGPPTKNPEIFARGIRNSVGLAFHPVTGTLYFTDNGGDNMGDDVPPDELNHAPKPGLHFGFPHYAGGDAVSPGYADRTPPANAQFPVVAFGAHVAALGIHFYTGAMFPPDYRNDAFVAQHGSWNRSVPDGYRIVRVRFGKDHTPIGKEVFATGWLEGRTPWGRPVDVTTLPDGSLLVSDDHAGAIYRITYDGSR